MMSCTDTVVLSGAGYWLSIDENSPAHFFPKDDSTALCGKVEMERVQYSPWPGEVRQCAHCRKSVRHQDLMDEELSVVDALIRLNDRLFKEKEELLSGSERVLSRLDELNDDIERLEDKSEDRDKKLQALRSSISTLAYEVDKEVNQRLTVLRDALAQLTEKSNVAPLLRLTAAQLDDSITSLQQTAESVMEDIRAQS